MIAEIGRPCSNHRKRQKPTKENCPEASLGIVAWSSRPPLRLSNEKALAMFVPAHFRGRASLTLHSSLSCQYFSMSRLLTLSLTLPINGVPSNSSITTRELAPIRLSQSLAFTEVSLIMFLPATLSAVQIPMSSHVQFR